MDNETVGKLECVCEVLLNYTVNLVLMIFLRQDDIIFMGLIIFLQPRTLDLAKTRPSLRPMPQINKHLILAQKTVLAQFSYEPITVWFSLLVILFGFWSCKTS